MEQKPEQSTDFFISYTSADQHWAEWIAWQLETAGFTTILQAWDFHPGGNFVVDMHKATTQAVRTIAVLSPDYLASRFTLAEWTEAFRRDPTGEQGILIPIRVRPCDVKGLLGQIVYIDLVDLDETLASQRLSIAINRRVAGQRGKPSRKPAFPVSSSPSREQTASAPAFPGALPPFWNIPYPRNPYFTGREEILARLAAALRTGEPAAIGQTQAISGLGGIGKTQLAIEYAYRYHQDYQAVLWVRAETRDELISGYVALAKLLQLPEQEEKEQLVVVQAVKDWLRTHERWLLILDNADDLALAREFLLTASQGHTLLTTRASSTGRLAHLIEVDTLDLEKGTHFLLRRAGLLAHDASIASIDAQELTQAQELVREMGGLPLALDQAGAYIDENKCSIKHYLSLSRTHRTQVLQKRGGLVPDHPQPVATTWSLSFQRIAEQSLAAADLLRACAFLQPDAIPEEILREGGKHLGPHIQALVADPIAFDQVLQLLLSYSLIRRNANEEQLSIHRLVQAVLIDGMDEQTQRVWAERIVAAVRAVLPDDAADHRQWQRYERCLAQVLGCVILINRWQVYAIAAFWLLRQTGWYLRERARYTEGEPISQLALEIGEHALGPKHSQVAYSLNDLAELYRDEGKYEEAEPLYKRALQIWEHTLGSTHPQVAYPLKGLANLYREQGKYEEAEPLYKQALQIWEQAWGLDHPQVAYPLNGLANLYRHQKKYEEAEPLYKRALRIWEQVWGLEHLLVAAPLNNLAVLYYLQGKYEEAEPLYKRALQIREQTLGPTHPQVASPLYGLANLYREQGKYEEAEPLYERALQIREQTLGPTHRRVASPLYGLANLYREQGKYEQAEPLYLRALHIREQVLGPSHPLTREVVENYVALLCAMKREREADELEARFPPEP